MAISAEILEGLNLKTAVRRDRPEAPAQPAPPLLPSWLQIQALNATRHSAALRPFRRDEFGTDAASPSEGHLDAVNALLGKLRSRLLAQSARLRHLAQVAASTADSTDIHRALSGKEAAHDWVRAIEKIWDFYFELFGQRQSKPYGNWL